MKIPARKVLAALLYLTLALLLSGCIKTSADELYQLPRTSREFMKLQEQIDAVLASGAEYAPPAGGDNRPSVQLADLDGDGVSEAIAFFVTTGENPLAIYIFRDVGDDYEVADVIEGVGSGIESVRYVDMDGSGSMVLVVGWQVGPALRNMTLYSMRALQHTKLADADYTALSVSDADGDGHPDVVAVRLGSSDAVGEATVFSLLGTGEIVSNSAHLSLGVESLGRVLHGSLSDGTPAVFVDGKLSGGVLITDIFAFSGSTLKNVSLSSAGGVAFMTLRYPTMNATMNALDINRDGVVEVPLPRLLPSLSTAAFYYRCDWYAYDLEGTQTLVMSTFHDYPDGWFLVLPPEWRYRISARLEDRVNGERTMIFSLVGDSAVHDFLKIYTLSGDNREDREKLPNRFRLFKDWGTIYAAELIDDGS
ncbi:MAG: VCBS repeat-containing protein, partial [Oscillospiraceae bacterium]|nr:VCBS repeat-containing protein [Oscillospiraceae bacterium]